MAKIRYLINGDPYQSMLNAIKSENIIYARFYKNFKEAWGRLSMLYWGDVWNDEIAKKTVNGVEVFGNESVRLFLDQEFAAFGDYRYTKKLLKLMGGDYDSLYNSRGDVHHFYVDLQGVTSTLDFTNELVVQNAMNNLEVELTGVDSIKLGGVVEQEVIFNTVPDIYNLSLAQVRGHGLSIDYNTGDYLASDLAPALSFFSLPTSSYRSVENYITVTSPIVVDENGVESGGVTSQEYVSTDEYYDRVEGTALSVGATTYRALATLLFHTDYIDSMFNSISITPTALPDRVTSEDDGAGGTITRTFARCRYDISFDFNSSVSTGLYKTTLADGTVSTPSPAPTGLTTDMTDYNYLGSSTFATFFSTKYKDAKSSYEAAANYDSDFGSPITPILETDLGQAFLAISAIVANLNSFSDVHSIFYSTGVSNSFINFSKSWLRFDVTINISNKEFSDMLITSIHLAYESKSSGGWFGGGFFGKLLEFVFTVVVVAVGIVFALATDGLSLVIAIGLLGATAKYGGMSQQGVSMAGFGVKILGVTAIAYGVYNIYNVALHTANATAISEAGAASGATLTTTEISTALASVGATEIVSAMGISGVASMMSSFYSAFNLLMPVDKVEQGDIAELPEVIENEAIHNVNTAYDFYDEVYDIYT